MLPHHPEPTDLTRSEPPLRTSRHEPVTVDGQGCGGPQVGDDVQNPYSSSLRTPQRKASDGRRPAPRRVFLSHTSELRELPEGTSFIAAAESAIIASGDAVTDMAYYTAHDLPPARVDHDMVANTDVYVLVAGFHYGSPVRDQPEMSYTEHEFETATHLGIPRLVFLLSEDTVGPGRLFRDTRYGARQDRFRQRLRNSGVTTRDVTSPDDLKAAILQALTGLFRTHAGATPAGRVWSIPARPARFTGREDHLVGLHAALTARKPVVVQAVHGMGGVGKTTLVTEYIHRHAEDYDIAWWVPAEHPDLIADRLAALAQTLSLAASTENTQAAVARLLGTLQARTRSLLMFDNAENPAIVAPFLPGGVGHVLITSRNPHWDAIAEPVEIGEFTRTESVTHIRTHLPGLSLDEAAQVAEALGDLPLAVDQAAALLGDTNWTVPTYLDLLHRSAQRLLDQRAHAGGYPLSVAASWRLAFDHLADSDRAAVHLITFAAWLAPHPIPLTLFTEHTRTLPEPLAGVASDPLAWAQVVAVLRLRSVARVGQDSLLLHRIPAALLRAHSPVAAPKNGWAALAVRVLRAALPTYPGDHPMTWPVWQALLPHVLTATGNNQAPDIVAEDVDWLLDHMATYLLARGEPRAARPHLERAYDRHRTRQGQDHPRTLAVADKLARGLRALREYEQARELDQDTLNRHRRILGDDHCRTLAATGNLADDLWGLGEYEQARKLSQDTLQRRRCILGEDHPSTLAAADKLADALWALGQQEQACNLLQDALHRRRHVVGNDSDKLASANNLARDLWALGQHEQARRWQW